MPAIVWGTMRCGATGKEYFVTAADPPRLEAQSLSWFPAAGLVSRLWARGLGNLAWTCAARGHRPRDCLPQTLSVRTRNGGETLKPAATATTQSVQHLCQSLGVLPWMRDALPLVFAGERLDRRRGSVARTRAGVCAAGAAGTRVFGWHMRRSVVY